MYIPKEFEIRNPDEIIDFISNHSFATIVSPHTSFPMACHLPLVVKTEQGKIILEGHISLANEQHRLLQDNTNVLCIFQGPHGYISSSVYHHHNVPTWNYQTVHAQGMATRLTREELLLHLSELVDQHEVSRENPLGFDHFDPKMIESYLREIVGFSIQIQKTEAAYKLSQNRNEEDHHAIVADLEKCPIHQDLANVMKKSRK